MTASCVLCRLIVAPTLRAAVVQCTEDNDPESRRCRSRSRSHSRDAPCAVHDIVYDDAVRSRGVVVVLVGGDVVETLRLITKPARPTHVWRQSSPHWLVVSGTGFVAGFRAGHDSLKRHHQMNMPFHHYNSSTLLSYLFLGESPALADFDGCLHLDVTYSEHGLAKHVCRTKDGFVSRHMPR